MAAKKKTVAKKSTKLAMKCAVVGASDHKCLGSIHTHVGMWVTLRVGSDAWPCRMVWVSDSGRQAVVMRNDYLTGDTKIAFGQRAPGIMIRQGTDGLWWEEGPKHVGKRPIELGVGVLDLDRGF